VNKAREDPQWAQESFVQYISFQNGRVRARELSASTFPNYFKPAKLFCEMNDISLNWKKIRKGLPTARQAANDLAPTVEEIQGLTEYPEWKVLTQVVKLLTKELALKKARNTR
jgi:hypothetical protein